MNQPKKFNKKDYEVLIYIIGYWSLHLRSPTFREIVEHTNLKTTSHANLIIDRLIERNVLLHKRSFTSRALIPKGMRITFDISVEEFYDQMHND